MSMHLAGPWLSTTGKSKKKQKFRNAEQAKQARELQENWNKLQAEFKSMSTVKGTNVKTSKTPRLAPPPGRETPHYPSRDSGTLGAVGSKQVMQYTGTKMVGIGTLHKSNAVPVFSGDEAQDIAKMRR